MIQKLQEFRTNNKWFRIATRNLVNAIIAWLVVLFTNIPGEFSAVILILLNFLTKYINLRYLNDFGVIKNLPVTPA